ncbi:MFS transporter [Streptomyces sp. NPDC058755]|uniref:MFS transporter n=1 Tax=unclassified Streptomyces TaxID=2593676 RepID=UPI0036BB541E
MQRRTVAGLFGAQLVGGIGVGIGVAVGVLFAARLAGESTAGLAGATLAVGAALLALPVAGWMRVRGRRFGLALGYLIAAAGAVLLAVTAWLRPVPLLFPAMFLFGCATTANFQARFAAVDLAPPGARGRSLSVVVWATTVGAVGGPLAAVPADRLCRRLGGPPMAGPFLLSALTLAVAAAIVALVLRPDPLLLARQAGLAGPPPRSGGRRSAFTEAARQAVAGRGARLGFTAVVSGHLVMLVVMSMTPVHLDHVGRSGVVSVVMSVHLAGMFGLAPVVGAAGDRFGRRAVIGAGALLLVCSCAIAASAGDDPLLLGFGIGLLGLGWSGTMIAGSTVLTESVSQESRPAVQGLVDLVMGLAGAGGTALAGAVVATVGYPTLAWSAAAALLPLPALLLRSRG